MMEPKHGLAILIANKGMGKGKEPAADDTGELDAMKAFVAAVKGDDPEAALEEFHNLMDMCGGGE